MRNAAGNCLAREHIRKRGSSLTTSLVVGDCWARAIQGVKPFHVKTKLQFFDGNVNLLFFFGCRQRFPLAEFEQQDVNTAAFGTVPANQMMIAGVLIQAVSEPLIEVVHLIVGATQRVVSLARNRAAGATPESPVAASPVLVEPHRPLRSIPIHADKLVLPGISNLRSAGVRLQR